MINENELKLLISLLNQVDKFGLDTFHSLCKKVRIGDIDFEFVLNIAEKTNLNKKSNNIDNLLNQQDDDRKTLILAVLNALQKRRFTLARTTSFFNEKNIKIPNATKKNELYTNLVNELVKLDSASLSKLVISIDDSIGNSFKNDPQRSLEAWSKVIMKEK